MKFNKGKGQQPLAPSITRKIHKSIPIDIVSITIHLNMLKYLKYCSIIGLQEKGSFVYGKKRRNRIISN